MELDLSVKESYEDRVRDKKIVDETVQKEVFKDYEERNSGQKQAS